MIQAPAVSLQPTIDRIEHGPVNETVSGTLARGLRRSAMFEVIALTAPNEPIQTRVIAINDAGVACGLRAVSRGRTMPALWSPNGLGRLLPCGPYGGGALAINSRGEAVGYEYVSSSRDRRRAVAWINGEFVVLPGLNGSADSSDAVAAAINADGVIGGRSDGRYLLWTPNGARGFVAKDIPARFSSFFGPNDTGSVVGRIGLPEQGDQQRLGFWHRTGVSQRAFPAVDGTFRYYVTGLNGLDQVLITGSDDRYDDLGWFSIVSDRREIVVDRRSRGLRLYAHDLNDAGTVVGRAERSDGDGFPFLWTAGEPVDLNRLVPEDAGVTVFTAMGINNRGAILAIADDSAGSEHQVLLMPVHPCQPRDENGERR
jgi:uncharacterized membrane protein